MGRLPRPRSDRQTLDLWIKGPVFYGTDTILSATMKAEFGSVSRLPEITGSRSRGYGEQGACDGPAGRVPAAGLSIA